MSAAGESISIWPGQEQWSTDQVKSSGWSSWLKTLMTMLLLEEQLILGPGNSPLMRITFWGAPSRVLVPYVTFHSKNR
jgi:hypothetical protein